MSHQKKRTLILGSSTGLGFAIAEAYANAGAQVAVTSRDLKRAEEAANQLPGASAFACDLSQEKAGRHIVDEVVKKFGGIDILITNAGGPPEGMPSELTDADWMVGYHSLWMSAIDAIHEAYPHMKKQNWGRILLSTSFSAKQPVPTLTISNAYRSGLNGLMKTVAIEAAPHGVTVNSILPGYTKTARLKEFKVSEKDLVAQIPAGRLGKPEEFAALALFLGSDEASYITGQSIACDGGLIRSL